MNTSSFLGRLTSAVIVLALGTSMLHSCSVEKEYELNGDPDEEGIEMILQAGTPGTRTDNSGDSTLWSEGDALSVFHSAAGQSTFWSSWFGYYYGNAFQGTVKKLSSTNDWYAVYPWREENTSPAQVRLTFASTQIQTGNNNKSHFAGETFPMFGKTKNLARSEELSMKMSNVLSAAQVKVTNTTDAPIIVEEVEFTAESYISGVFTVDVTGDSPVITPVSGAKKSVTLAVEEGEEIAAGAEASFYLAIAPYEVPAGGEIDIKVVAVHPSAPQTRIFYYHTITVENGATFESGHIKGVKVSFDEESSQNPDAGSAGEVELEPGEQPEDGTYLLVYENGENSLAFAPLAAQEPNNYAIPVTVVDGVVIPEDGQDLSIYAVTIENTGNKHACDDNAYAYDVKNSEEYYIFYSEDVLRIEPSNEYTNSQGSANFYYHTFVQYEDGIQIRSAQNSSGAYQYLLTYSQSKGFHYSRDESDQGEKLHLYLLGGSVKEKQTLSFTTDKVTYNFDEGGDFPEPTLHGAKTLVTYSSSNESVATVDAHGNVTIHKAGSAIITATAEADGQYYSGTAQYSIISTTSQARTFYLATKLTAGEEYIVVSANNALTNNGGNIGATSVTAVNGEIQVTDPAIIWTAATLGSGFTLSNEGQFIQRATGNSSGSTAAPFIGSAPSTDRYYIWVYDNSNMYLSTVAESNYSAYYIYYSGSAWAQSSSASSSQTVTLYSATKPRTPQTLSFNKQSIVWTIGVDCETDQSYAFPQTVSGAQTLVTYTSSNEDVATISDNNRITVVGIGSTTITATAVANTQYEAGTASYNLRISTPAPEGFTNLGSFNLENDDVKDYLDNGVNDYTDDNYTGNGSVTHVASYAHSVPTHSESSSGGGWGGFGGEQVVYPEDRIDVPNPVQLFWTNASVGEATVSIYSDQDLEDLVWDQSTAVGSTSANVYNLIPGETYYCTVVDTNGDYLLKGVFTTEGRRRMIRLSDRNGKYNRGNNFRDLGGMVTADGTKRIKYGWIFRGTNLDDTDEYEKAVITDFLNIGWDIDLRQSSEGSAAFASGSGVTYVMCDYNATISALTENNTKVKKTVQAFIDAAKAGKASYFHCRIGSDRTGYWGLLIEGLLGVSPRDCSIDYELTSFANGVTSGNRTRTSGLYKDGMDYFKKKSYYNGNLEYTITKYLTDEVGITASDIDTFKGIVLENN